jgi:CO/xanthine dehydrogenase FAD-binding subunit
MRIRPFEYFAASSLSDALKKLDHYGPEARVLAGGTDLVLAMKEKQIVPRRVISLHKVKELDFVRTEDATVRIGGLARHADLAMNTTLNESFPLLCEAVGLIGSWQIRNVATIGGNLCTASPAADSAPPLLVLNARVVVADAKRENEIPLGSFFTGPGETVLKPNQLLKEILIDRPKAQSVGCYLKLMRKKAVDLSVVGVAFQAEVDQKGEKLTRVGIGLGGVAPTPIRAAEAEAKLTGFSYEEAFKRIPEAARAAVDATAPISDVRASADYRRAMVEVYVQRAAKKALNQLYDGVGV